MSIVLGPNQYGKAENRLVRVYRDTARHEIRDLNVSSALRGDFRDAHITGDQSAILPTDTQKNTVFAFAKEKAVNSIEEFGLTTEPLLRLATIVRGADTGRPNLAPQAAGLLAVSLGLSRMYTDDLAQLEAGLSLYDAFYRWCRDAVEETHIAHAQRPGI